MENKIFFQELPRSLNVVEQLQIMWDMLSYVQRTQAIVFDKFSPKLHKKNNFSHKNCLNFGETFFEKIFFINSQEVEM